MGKWLEMAKPVRAVMDKAGAMLTDAQASTVPALYAGMRYDGALIKAGARILWQGVLKRAAADLWDRPENDPEHAPALWEDVLYRDGVRIIPEVITAGLAFSRGELGWWGGALYRSTADNNVYTPQQHPDNWELADVQTGKGEQP